jgi:hypothetical protein
VGAERQIESQIAEYERELRLSTSGIANICWRRFKRAAFSPVLTLLRAPISAARHTTAIPRTRFWARRGCLAG